MGFFNRFTGKKVLYFPGCPAKFLVKDVQRRHEQILTQLEVEYVKLPELEVCCGKPAIDFGFPEEFKDLKSKNKTTFQNQRIGKIITSDPSCYQTFKKKYEDLEVEHISQTILKNIEKLGNVGQGQEITFIDPCNPHKLTELYNIPRQILESLGFSLIELANNKENSMCCGKAIELVSPKVGEKMAQELLKQVTTKMIVTTSPDCYQYLKKQNHPGVEVLEFTEVLV
jgi:heterodisulfide reductase subunit D